MALAQAERVRLLRRRSAPGSCAGGARKALAQAERGWLLRRRSADGSCAGGALQALAQAERGSPAPPSSCGGPPCLIPAIGAGRRPATLLFLTIKGKALHLPLIRRERAARPATLLLSIFLL